MDEEEEYEIHNNFYSRYSGIIPRAKSINASANSVIDSTTSERIYEEIESTGTSRKPVLVLPKKSLPKKSIALVTIIMILIIVNMVLSSALTVSLIKFSKKEKDLQDTYKSNATLSKENDLRMQLEMLRESCAVNGTTLISKIGDNNNDTNGLLLGSIQLQNCTSNYSVLIKTNKTICGNSSKLVKSCKMLPNSSPSGYYMILASNGSAIKVYCEMNEATCGGVSGGWMRVTSLDMKESSAKCPSSLCLNATAPRTCRRCYTPGKINFAAETYQVGVSYSSVCGRLIAFQVGRPNAYSLNFSLGVDGISLTYGSPERNIWTFIAAEYNWPSSTCPCIIPNSIKVPAPPDFISNHYFCDTALNVSSEKAEFYSENPLWDGVGCQGKNQCCSFNNPPWFHRKLPESSSMPIVMKIGLNEPPTNEDLGVEVIDIYVQ